MAEFSCTTDILPGMAVVHAAGDIDLATADRLWGELLAQLLPDTRVVLDCGAVSFCDSTGLRTLIRAHHHAAATGADFALAAVAGPVEELIKLAGVTGEIPVIDAPAAERRQSQDGAVVAEGTHAVNWLSACNYSAWARPLRPA